MLYINQRKYPDMPYQHNLKHGGAPADKSNISSAGCGLCCLCMVVENMTMHSFSLEECRQMVYDLKANMSAGSDLQIMGPAVAEKFGLTYDQTDDINKMLAHVHAGGMAVANSGGDREGYEGVFTHGGHYSWWFPPTRHRPASLTRRWSPASLTPRAERARWKSTSRLLTATSPF